jgi:hypothetical protein
VGFVVDKVALGQVSAEYLRFSCHLPLHIHLSSGAGTTGQILAKWTQSHPTPKEYIHVYHLRVLFSWCSSEQQMVTALNLYLPFPFMAITTEELNLDMWNCVCRYIINTCTITGRML